MDNEVRTFKHKKGKLVDVRYQREMCECPICGVRHTKKKNGGR